LLEIERLIERARHDRGSHTGRKRHSGNRNRRNNNHRRNDRNRSGGYKGKKEKRRS
jgi:hypothetical protein